MSEQAKFQEWWECYGTNSVILRAQAWSAWSARAKAEQQPDPHLALLEAEHDDRNQPDPDEWVIQDRAPVRVGVDRITWHSSSAGDSIPPHPRGDSQGKRHGDVHPTNHLLTLRVWCRRRDLPPVNEHCTCPMLGEFKVTGSSCPQHGLPTVEWDDVLGKQQPLPFADKPQPAKTRVRLWKWKYGGEARLADVAPSGDWVEVKHDAEGFYVEEANG